MVTSAFWASFNSYIFKPTPWFWIYEKVIYDGYFNSACFHFSCNFVNFFMHGLWRRLMNISNYNPKNIWNYWDRVEKHTKNFNFKKKKVKGKVFKHSWKFNLNIMYGRIYFKEYTNIKTCNVFRSYLFLLTRALRYYCGRGPRIKLGGRSEERKKRNSSDTYIDIMI